MLDVASVIFSDSIRLNPVRLHCPTRVQRLPYSYSAVATLFGVSRFRSRRLVNK